MTLQQAYDVLKAAGLHLHGLGDRLLGGSHVDASSGFRMIENSFHIFPEGDAYRVRMSVHGQGEGVGGLSLEDAVKLVLDTIKPQPNVEAPPQPPTKGPVLY